jgi:N6-adenosine-specific RNA methylase IME4
MTNPFTDKKYQIIYADPPWNFKVWSKNTGKGGRCPDKHYPTMSLDEIKNLPVPSDNNCALFIWVTYPMLQEGFETIKAWGFSYRTVAFTWAKLNPKGLGFSIGLGYWTRANPEICLLATRGTIKRIDKSIPNLLVSPRREHSRKPDEIRDRIVKLVGDLPRIELFARQKTEGWDVWGNEV